MLCSGLSLGFHSVILTKRGEAIRISGYELLPYLLGVGLVGLSYGVYVKVVDGRQGKSRSAIGALALTVVLCVACSIVAVMLQ